MRTSPRQRSSKGLTASAASPEHMQARRPEGPGRLLLRPDPALVAAGVSEVQPATARKRIRCLHDAAAGPHDGLLGHFEVLAVQQHEPAAVGAWLNSQKQSSHLFLVTNRGGDAGVLGAVVDEFPVERLGVEGLRRGEVGDGELNVVKRMVARWWRDGVMA